MADLTISPELRRLFKAALAYRGDSITSWAARTGVSIQHVKNMLQGHIPSRPMSTAIRAYTRSALTDACTELRHLFGRKAA